VSPDAWLLSAGAPSNAVTQGAQHMEGGFSLEAKSTGGQSFTVYQDVPVVAGKTYSFNGNIMIPTSTGSFNATVQLVQLSQFGGTVGNPSTMGTAQTTTSTSWIPTNGSITIPQTGVTTLRVQLKLTTLKADVFTDGFSLIRTN